MKYLTLIEDGEKGNGCPLIFHFISCIAFKCMFIHKKIRTDCLQPKQKQEAEEEEKEIGALTLSSSFGCGESEIWESPPPLCRKSSARCLPAEPLVERMQTETEKTKTTTVLHASIDSRINLPITFPFFFFFYHFIKQFICNAIPQTPTFSKTDSNRLSPKTFISSE